MAANKQKLLKVINPIIGILFFSQALSGFFNDFIPYEIFSKTHGLGGYLLVAGVIIHVIVNWSWFKTAFKKRK